MTDNDTRDYRVRELAKATPRPGDDYKPSIKVTAPGGESKWLRITSAEYVRVVEALTTEPPITYRVQPHEITSLTWPMWEACGIECPKMIGAACPADEAHFRKTCPGWSGKFPSAAAEVVHGWTMTSDQSDTCGETDAPFGWNALFRNPDRGTHDGPMGAGLILHTNSPGSVVLNRYESVEALDEVWADLQEREAEYDRANCVECADEPCWNHRDDDESDGAPRLWEVVDDSGTVLTTVEADDRTGAEWLATSVPGAHDAVGVGVRPAPESKS